MKKGFKTLALYLVLIAIVVVVVMYVSGSFSPKEEVTFSDVYNYFKNEEVAKFEMSNSNVLTIYKWKDRELKMIDENNPISYEVRSLSLFHEVIFEKFVHEQVQAGVIQSFDYEPEATIPFWVSFLPYIFLIAIIVIF